MHKESQATKSITVSGHWKSQATNSNTDSVHRKSQATNSNTVPSNTRYHKVNKQQMRDICIELKSKWLSQNIVSISHGCDVSKSQNMTNHNVWQQKTRLGRTTSKSDSVNRSSLILQVNLNQNLWSYVFESSDTETSLFKCSSIINKFRDFSQLVP